MRKKEIDTAGRRRVQGKDADPAGCTRGEEERKEQSRNSGKGSGSFNNKIDKAEKIKARRRQKLQSSASHDLLCTWPQVPVFYNNRIRLFRIE